MGRQQDQELIDFEHEMNFFQFDDHRSELSSAGRAVGCKCPTPVDTYRSPVQIWEFGVKHFFFLRMFVFCSIDSPSCLFTFGVGTGASKKKEVIIYGSSNLRPNVIHFRNEAGKREREESFVEVFIHRMDSMIGKRVPRPANTCRKRG